MKRKPELEAFYSLKVIPLLKTHTVLEFCQNNPELLDEVCKRNNMVNDTNLPFKQSKVKKHLDNIKNNYKNKITNADNVLITKEKKTIEKKIIKSDNDIVTTIITETEIKKEDATLYWKHPAHQKQDELCLSVIEDMKAKMFMADNYKLFFGSEKDKDKSLIDKYSKYLEDPVLKQLATLNNRILNKLNAKDETGRARELELNELLYIASASDKIQKIKESIISVYNKTVDTVLKVEMSRRAMIENSGRLDEMTKDVKGLSVKEYNKDTLKKLLKENKLIY